MLSFLSARTPQPDLLTCAMHEVGVSEVSGRASNPRIDEYLSTVGLSGDETPWCAAFVNWVLEASGLPGTGAPNARSFLRWGMDIPLDDAQPGDIVVFARGSSSWEGHVAFFSRRVDSATIAVVGGNQKNSVCEDTYSTDRLLGVRRLMRKRDSTTIAAGSAAGALTVAKAVVDGVDAAHTAVTRGADTLAKASETAASARDMTRDMTREFAGKLAPAPTSIPQVLVPAPTSIPVPAPTQSPLSMLSLGLTVIVVALIAYIIVERVRKLWKHQ